MNILLTLPEECLFKTPLKTVPELLKVLRTFSVSWDIHQQISILLLFILMWCLSVMKLLNGSSR